METIILRPKEKCTATIIFMHGLGDTGHGWEDVMKDFQKAYPYIKMILPTAPTRKLIMRNGYSMTAWYDRDGSKTGLDVFLAIEESRQQVMQFIEDEVKQGIPYERIMIGGFSQGAVLAYYTAFQMKNKLAGCLPVSGVPPLVDAFASTLLTKESTGTVLLAIHGDADPLMDVNQAQQSVDALKTAGVDATLKIYKGLGHSINHTVLRDISAFIAARLPSVNRKSEL